jgi:hypothetical protein
MKKEKEAPAPSMPFEGSGFYYYWETFGEDPTDPLKPEWVQLMARNYETWPLKHWGFFPNGLGEAAWRMGIYVACHPEDDLAVMSLFYMLDNRIRYFGKRPPRSVPIWKKLRRYGHSRRNFTRDPIVTGLFGLMVAGRHDLIKELRFPWKISLWHSLTPTLWAWIKFLKTRKGKWAKLFHLFTIIEYWIGNKLNTIPMYARHLMSYMLFICPNAECSAAVMEKVPEENLLLHFLNDYDQEILLMSKPEEYVSRKGWVWQGEDFKNLPPEIPSGEDYYLDYEILQIVSQLWMTKKLQENPMNLLAKLLNDGSERSIRN